MWNAYSKLDSLFGLLVAVGIFSHTLRSLIFRLRLIWRKLAETLVWAVIIIKFNIRIYSCLKLIECWIIVTAKILFFD